MRIDLKTGTHEAGALGSTERADADAKSARTAGGARKSGDSVQVSTEAQLLNSALKAASETPATRADRIEDVRRKLAAGELGQDAGRLADRIIDDLLGN